MDHGRPVDSLGLSDFVQVEFDDPVLSVAIQYTDTLDRTFHALGDASRRRMLAALGTRGACSAGELGELFDSTQPTVSRHLRVLEEAELVRRQIVGRRHVFSLAPERVQEARSWMDRHLAFWQAAFDQLEELRENPRGKANEK